MIFAFFSDNSLTVSACLLILVLSNMSPFSGLTDELISILKIITLPSILKSSIVKKLRSSKVSNSPSTVV